MNARAQRTKDLRGTCASSSTTFSPADSRAAAASASCSRRRSPIRSAAAGARSFRPAENQILLGMMVEVGKAQEVVDDAPDHVVVGGAPGLEFAQLPFKCLDERRHIGMLPAQHPYHFRHDPVPFRRTATGPGPALRVVRRPSA